MAAQCYTADTGAAIRLVMQGLQESRKVTRDVGRTQMVSVLHVTHPLVISAYLLALGLFLQLLSVYTHAIPKKGIRFAQVK